jgi:DNA mismatch repair ATPase MutL
MTLFFGRELRDQVYPIDFKQGAVRLFGCLADPGYERGNGRMQYFFVNDRWIRDRMLGHALQEAYRGLLMTGRYAVAFLFLSMPPDHVDVNVHPTKAEVRFRDSSALYRLVHDSVRQRLSDENLTARLYVTSTLATPQAQVVPPPEKMPIYEQATPLPNPPVFPRPGQAVPTPTTNGAHAPRSPRRFPRRRLRCCKVAPSPRRRRSSFITLTWCWKRQRGCWSSTSMPCMSASCSSNSNAASAPARWKYNACSSPRRWR